MTEPLNSPLTAGDASPPPPAGAAGVPATRMQVAVGAGVLVTAACLAWGALDIPSNSGYGGVGPNFLPWLVSAVLAVCGIFLLWEALSGGYRELDAATGAERADKGAFVWVSAGLLLNAALITTLGFILSCTLCYMLAVQGLRRAAGQPAAGQVRTWITDLVTGLLISAPVFWAFTQFLAINLPGLTNTGWL